MALQLHNTLSKQKEPFVPLEPGQVRMYVCGITSSGPPHVGHARAYVAFDVLYRWLSREHRVRFARNYTDVDDKIIAAARAAGEDSAAFAERQMAQFAADMDALGCARPTVEPRVTEHIPEIIALIQRLVEKELAYDFEGNVFFHVPGFKAYGALSGRTLEVLRSEDYRAWAGRRLKVPRGKETVHDFALWKAAVPGEPSWPSPWGPGRPGWHIECSAMAMKHLGETIDIHGGGRDLIFPHHDNELAQCCGATGEPLFARVWMHNGFVNLMPERCPACAAPLAEADDERPGCKACGHALSKDELRMSKSRGNFYPIREIVERYQAEALRHLLLMSHYRSEVHFSHRLLEDTEARLDRTYETLRKVELFLARTAPAPGPSFAEVYQRDVRARFQAALDDDLNTALALADLAEVFKDANELLEGTEGAAASLTPGHRARLLGELSALVREAGGVLGLWQQAPERYLERRKSSALDRAPMAPAEIQALIEERNLARRARDYARSDQIREVLKARGIGVKDTPGATDWYVIREG